jgi:hypothetical protein
MKKKFVILVSASLIFLSCSESETTKAENEIESYQIAKESLQDKEVKNPQNFLTVTGNNRNNLVGQTVVKGTITNKATVASYKDVDIKLDFYSKTGTLLETDKETVYEIIAPGQSKNFKTKYFAPKGTDSVALMVISAKISEK